MKELLCSIRKYIKAHDAYESIKNSGCNLYFAYTEESAVNDAEFELIEKINNLIDTRIASKMKSISENP